MPRLHVLVAPRIRWPARRKARSLFSRVLAALDTGVSREENSEVLLHAAIYCGVPAAISGFRAAAEVLKEIDAEG